MLEMIGECMKKRKRVKKFRKLQKKFFFQIIFLLTILLLILIVLDSYLFHIRREEWLSKKSDFKDYSVSFIQENRCQLKERIQKNNITYYTYCFDMVYVHFGGIQLTLEEAIEKDYLTLASFLENTIQLNDEGDYSVYEKKRNQDFPYLIKVNEKDPKHIILVLAPSEVSATNG